MSEVNGAVVEAEIELAVGADPAAVGAIVSNELCGCWDHEGPCRWPHRNEVDADSSPARFHTVVVAPAGAIPEVLRRIDSALRADARWTVIAATAPETRPEERELADQLAALPRLAT